MLTKLPGVNLNIAAQRRGHLRDRETAGER